MTNEAASDLPYRRCVGIMLLNRDGLAFVGRRIGPAGNEHVARGFDWQMPQGGIDEGETPEESARRELAEETGVRRASLVREAPDWLSYDIPPALIGRRWVGKYRGQTQKWFAYRFEGDEAEIDIAAPQGHSPEFDAWRWVAMHDLPDLVIPFKREVYRAVVEAFADLAA